MNQCNFIGRLGQDTRTSTVKDKPVANFSLAVDKGYGDNKSTLWINCALWDKPNLHPYLTKGTQVYVTGEIDMRSYQKDGVEKFSLELRVYNIQLLGGNQQAAPVATTQTPGIPVISDDLPF